MLAVGDDEEEMPGLLALCDDDADEAVDDGARGDIEGEANGDDGPGKQDAALHLARMVGIDSDDDIDRKPKELNSETIANATQKERAAARSQIA